MNSKLSRRKIAEYVVSRIENGRIPEQIIQAVAAYLLESRRLRELTLVVRAIEDALSDHGVVVATVTSAYPLSLQLRQAVVDMLDADAVYLREQVDSSVIGGLRLQTPDASYDGTVVHKLQALRAAKV